MISGRDNNKIENFLNNSLHQLLTSSVAKKSLTEIVQNKYDPPHEILSVSDSIIYYALKHDRAGYKREKNLFFHILDRGDDQNVQNAQLEIIRTNLMRSNWELSISPEGANEMFTYFIDMLVNRITQGELYSETISLNEAIKQQSILFEFICNSISYKNMGMAQRNIERWIIDRNYELAYSNSLKNGLKQYDALRILSLAFLAALLDKIIICVRTANDDEVIKLLLTMNRLQLNLALNKDEIELFNKYTKIYIFALQNVELYKCYTRIQYDFTFYRVVIEFITTKEGGSVSDKIHKLKQDYVSNKNAYDKSHLTTVDAKEFMDRLLYNSDVVKNSIPLQKQ